MAKGDGRRKCDDVETWVDVATEAMAKWGAVEEDVNEDGSLAGWYVTPRDADGWCRLTGMKPAQAQHDGSFEVPAYRLELVRRIAHAGGVYIGHCGGNGCAEFPDDHAPELFCPGCGHLNDFQTAVPIEPGKSHMVVAWGACESCGLAWPQWIGYASNMPHVHEWESLRYDAQAYGLADYHPIRDGWAPIGNDGDSMPYSDDDPYFNWEFVCGIVQAQLRDIAKATADRSVRIFDPFCGTGSQARMANFARKYREN